MFDALKSVRLSATDRAALRDRLALHAAGHPAPVRVSVFTRLFHTTARTQVPSPYYSLIFKPMPIAAIALVLALLGGGTSFAAEGALPGDVLYPVKVHVNESVQEALAFSSESKANVNADLAARRLDEAQQLAAQGKLSTTTAATLAANFKTHADKADAEVEDLAKDDPTTAAEIDSSLSARFAANRDILDALSHEGEHNSVGILASLTARLAAATTSGTSVNAEALANLSDSALTALSARAKNALADANAALALGASATASSTATSSEAIFAARAATAATLAATRYGDGTTALAAANKADAYAAFIDSLSASAQAEIYAKAALRVTSDGRHGQEDQGERDDSWNGATSTPGEDTRGDNQSEDRGGKDSHGPEGGLRINATTSVDVEGSDGEDGSNIHLEGGIRGGLGL